jgi:hypothetical protein
MSQEHSKAQVGQVLSVLPGATPEEDEKRDVGRYVFSGKMGRNCVGLLRKPWVEKFTVSETGSHGWFSDGWFTN